MPDWTNMQFQPHMWDPNLVKEAGTNTGLVLFKQPQSNEINVEPDTLFIIRMHHPDYAFLINTLQVLINGVTAVDDGEFTNGFTGILREEFGGFVLGIIPPENVEYDSTMNVKMGLADSSFEFSTDVWIFDTSSNPTCYLGNAPLPIEKELSLPMNTFLEVEALRRFMLGACLKTNVSSTNKNNKATRVLYQMAYSTELSSILNPYLTVNDEALLTPVCEQRKAIEVSKKLDKRRSQIIAAIQELQTHGVLPREYVTTLFDYLDSTLFNYKLSLVANIILFAKAVELDAK